MAKILIVGENIGAIDLMAASAEGLGYDAITLYQSVDAVETAIAEEVGLVIVEEDMKYFNGYEVCEALRADPDVPRELPVLLMTTGKVDVRDLHKYGFTDTILPELDPAALREIFVKLTGE